MTKGIDYGMGKTNIDRSNGIRFGVISQNEVIQAWSDSSEPEYPPIEDVECESCGGSGEVSPCAADIASGEHSPDDLCECEECEGTGKIAPDECDGMSEPIAFNFAGNGYRCTQGGDGTDIFILKSPYYTRAAFCSPCAPGACYLMSPCDDGDKAYCFGHGWFYDSDTKRAPYPVYRVSDDTLVLPDAE